MPSLMSRRWQTLPAPLNNSPVFQLVILLPVAHVCSVMFTRSGRRDDNPQTTQRLLAKRQTAIEASHQTVRRGDSVCKRGRSPQP